LLNNRYFWQDFFYETNKQAIIFINKQINFFIVMRRHFAAFLLLTLVVLGLAFS